MDLDDLDMYRQAMVLGESIWKTVESWPRFSQDTMGKQLVRSSDSVAANISEGQGRFHYLERRKFLYYSRGSLQETLTWIRKANMLGLITDDELQDYTERIFALRRLINGYIRFLNKQSSS